MVQTAHHATQLVHAIESSIKDGSPPHDMIFEGVRVPWEHFYFDTTSSPAAQPWDQLSTVAKHPVAVKLVCGEWEETTGPREKYQKGPSRDHKKLVLTTSKVATDKLPAAGTTVMFYGVPTMLTVGCWLWLNDSRDIQILSRPEAP